jgi:hypothetical protein
MKMSSKYKYFPALLTEYTKKSSQPVKIYSSNVLTFHYSVVENTYFKENFDLNPFDERQIEYQDYFESLPVEEEGQPELMVSGRYSNLLYDNFTGEAVKNIFRTSYPNQFIAHDKWWEYENFKKFPDYPVWYQFKFKEWHKHMVMSRYQTVTYDPLWVLDTNNNYALQMFYYSTTMRYYKPWKNPDTSGTLYESQRPFFYFLMGLSFFFCYWVGQLRRLSNSNHAMLNEDFWHLNYDNFKISMDKSSPYRIVVEDEIEGILNSSFFKFLIGIKNSKLLVEDFRKSGSMSKQEFFEIYENIETNN